MGIKEQIVDSAKEIFSTMILMDVAETEREEQATHKFKNSISGIIGLAGIHKGLLAVHLPNSVALAITSSFLGMDVLEINEDVEDAVGELANMLGGNLKTILSEKGRDVELSLPSTISGSEYGLQSAKDAKRTHIYLKCDAGKFSIEMQIQK